jgi:hypothetical protein
VHILISNLKQSVVIPTCNPSTWDAEAGRSWVSLGYIAKPCLTKQNKSKPRNNQTWICWVSSVTSGWHNDSACGKEVQMETWQAADPQVTMSFPMGMALETHGPAFPSISSFLFPPLFLPLPAASSDWGHCTQRLFYPAPTPLSQPRSGDPLEGDRVIQFPVPFHLRSCSGRNQWGPN